MIEQYFQKTRLMHPHYIKSPNEQDNERTRKRDPKHYQKACDNLFPLKCSDCDFEITEASAVQDLARHVSTHYVGRRKGRKKQ